MREANTANQCIFAAQLIVRGHAEDEYPPGGGRGPSNGVLSVPTDPCDDSQASQALHTGFIPDDHGRSMRLSRIFLPAVAALALATTALPAYADATPGTPASANAPVFDTTASGGPATTGTSPDSGPDSSTTGTPKGASPMVCTRGGSSVWTTQTKSSTFLPVALATQIKGPATIQGAVSAGTTVGASVTGAAKWEVGALLAKAEGTLSITLSASVTTGIAYTVTKPIPAGVVGHMQLGISGYKVTFNTYEIAAPCRIVLVSSKSVTAPLKGAAFEWNYWQTKS